MRVIVLGGAGDMGQRAVRILAGTPEVARLTIADLNLERASALARELGGGPRVQAVRVDAADRHSLVAAMQGHQVAASAIGPFYKFEVPVCRAALAAGVDYVSLCDDYDAAREILTLHGEAAAAGRRVITGLGWTPGLSNVLARRGVDLLDRADAVDIAWVGAAADSRGFAVVLHTIHIFTGLVPSFADGRWIEVQAGSGRVKLDFPAPLGTCAVFHVGHPEPVTIPRFIPGLKQVTLRGGLAEPFLNRLGLLIARLGLTSSVRKKDALGRLIYKLLPALERIGPRGLACSGLRVEVRGQRGGRPARVLFGAADHMENLTGIPLAIGALMLARGQVACPPGVWAPEARGAVDPVLFLQELASHGVRVQERLEEGDGGGGPWHEMAGSEAPSRCGWPPAAGELPQPGAGQARSGEPGTPWRT